MPVDSETRVPLPCKLVCQKTRSLSSKPVLSLRPGSTELSESAWARWQKPSAGSRADLKGLSYCSAARCMTAVLVSQVASSMLLVSFVSWAQHAVSAWSFVQGCIEQFDPQDLAKNMFSQDCTLYQHQLKAIGSRLACQGSLLRGLNPRPNWW